MTDHPKVAVVTDSLSPLAGGMYFSARIPANLMARRGRSPVVIGLDDAKHAETAHYWQVDRLEAEERKGPGGFLSTSAMLRLVKAAEPDLLHLRGIWGPYGLAARLWRKQTGRPLLISPHGMLDPYALSISRAKKWIARILYADAMLRSASAMHALNRSEAEAFQRLGLAKPIAIIPNGVDVFPIAERQPEEGRTRRMAFLSRIHPKKGLDQLIRGWRKALHDHSATMSGWKLTLAGWDDGGHLERLEALVVELGLEGSVTFPGPQFDDAKRAYLDSADAFILPSFSEGLPVSVLEAWERSLPVLMTDACNLPEGFAVGAAVRVEPDVASIAAQLGEFCARPQAERMAMGAKGRAMVQDGYGWESITDKYLELYDWLAGRRGSPPPFVEVPA